MCLEVLYFIYMYNHYLAFYNLQCLICRKTKPFRYQNNACDKILVRIDIFPWSY